MKFLICFNKWIWKDWRERVQPMVSISFMSRKIHLFLPSKLASCHRAWLAVDLPEAAGSSSAWLVEASMQPRYSRNHGDVAKKNRYLTHKNLIFTHIKWTFANHPGNYLNMRASVSVFTGFLQTFNQKPVSQNISLDSTEKHRPWVSLSPCFIQYSSIFNIQY